MDNSDPAFPVPKEVFLEYTGMTLRDYFAGQAIPALIRATYIQSTATEVARAATTLLMRCFEKGERNESNWLSRYRR